MGDFGGKRWRPYLDQEARQLRDEKLDHLQREYEGPSHFLKEKLREEQVKDLDQRIEEKERTINQAKDDLDRLRQIKEERDQQQTLRDKKELLKSKQEKLRELRSNQELSEEQVEEEIIHDLQSRSALPDSEQEIRETRAFSKMKSKRFGGSSLDELVSDVERLQSEIEELNGGEELDCFLELSQDAAEVSS